MHAAPAPTPRARRLRARTRRWLRRADPLAQRYRRAELEWRLNPTPDSAAARAQAWRALIEGARADPR